MRKFLTLLSVLTIVMLAVISVSAADNIVWDFTDKANLEKWTLSATTTATVSDQGTKFVSKGEDNDMNIAYVPANGEVINLDDYAIFAVEYRDASAAGTMQFYHWTEGCEGAPRIDVGAKAGSSITSFKLDVLAATPDTANWKGKVTKFRLDPLRGTAQREVTIVYIGLFKNLASYTKYLKGDTAAPIVAGEPALFLNLGEQNPILGTSGSNCLLDYEGDYAIMTSLNGPEDGAENRGDPSVAYNCDFDGNKYPWIKFRVRNLSKATQFEFHFASEGNESKVTASSCTHFPISAEDADFVEYIYNIKDYNLKSQSVNKDVKLTESVWKGNVSTVRFDCMWIAEPSGQMPTGSKMYIDYVGFFESEDAAKKHIPSTESMVEKPVIDSGKANPSWIFNNEEIILKWGGSGIDISMEGGVMRMQPTSSDPIISYSLSHDEQFDTKEFPYFAYRHSTKSKVSTVGLFYTTTNLPSLTDASYSPFTVDNMGNWSNAIVDLSDLSKYPKANWTGTCTSLRIDPINGEDTDAVIYIDRMGFFRTRAEATTFLKTGVTGFDHTLKSTFSSKLQKSIVPAGSLTEGYNKANYMLSSTAPVGEGHDPVVLYNAADGTQSVVALSYTTSGGYTTFVANKSGNYTLGYNHKDYTDVSSHWGAKYIDFVSDRKLFGGTSETEFSPEMTMTRGMFITVLGRMHGVDTSVYNGETGYGDVSASEYYAPYIQWAKAFSIMDGLSAVTFAPEDPISREVMATVISNYIKAFDCSFSCYDDIVEFNDLAGCDAATVNAIKAAQNAGIINGKGDNKFDPKGISTRAEVATVMQRVIKAVLGVNMATTQYDNDYITRDRIRIGVWGFDSQLGTPKSMQQLRDLGADLIVSGSATSSSMTKNTVLNYADKYGIEVYVGDYPISKNALANGSDPRVTSAAYADHPSFGGTYFTDEPGTESYPWLGELANDYIKKMPGKTPFVNLLPMYANAAQLKYGAGAAAIEYYDSDPDLFRSYCQEWFKYFNTDYICTDIYPLNGSENSKTTYKDYCESINQIATVARENGKEFWCCIQTWGWAGGKRNPTEMEYRWQCYTMLSYGCTGILLWSVTSGDPDYPSIFNMQTLEPTQPLYDNCKTVMWEMREISDLFVSYKNLGAFTHNYSSAVPYLRMTNEYKDFKILSEIKCDNPLLFGAFEKKEGKGYAFTVVNMTEFSSDEASNIKFKVADSSPVTLYFRGKPTTMTPKDGYYTLDLDCGDAAFITIG